jgi:hypothetical protein
MFKRNNIIIIFFLSLVLTGGVFLARGNFNSSLSVEQLSENGGKTELISAEIIPYKVKVGDVQTTIVKIKDDIGIEKISAQIPFEGGYDEISLKLVKGDKKDGIWKGEWKAHNTKVKEYVTKIIAINKEGKIRNVEASWWDDTETVWYDQNWTKRKKVTLTENSGSTLTNYQVKITIAYDSDMQADFDDIRFTKADGATLLDHWRESYTASTTADFWVEVDSMTASTTTDIYYYYGNSAASSVSNGDATFDFFDDFEDGDTTSGGVWETATNYAATDQVKFGTYSFKLPAGTGHTKSKSFGSLALGSYVIGWWGRIDGTTDVAETGILDSGDAIWDPDTGMQLSYSNSPPNIMYYDGAWKDTGRDIAIDTWTKIEIVQSDTTFKIRVDDGAWSGALGNRNTISDFNKYS